jgi:hypothetical protein
VLLATLLIVLPATAGHGWDLVFGTTTRWSPLAATIAAFIRGHATADGKPTGHDKRPCVAKPAPETRRQTWQQ